MKKSVLVVFGSKVPRGSDGNYDEVISGEKLNALIDAGSVEEASELLRELSLLKDNKGDRLSKIVSYRGYELWWIHYDDLMYKLCLPYTQYKRLLEYLKGYERIYIHNPPFADLFDIYLSSFCRSYSISREHPRSMPLGIILQLLLTIPFLLWARLKSPKLMVWSSDLFDPPHDYDFRMKFIYEELRGREINFVEFIRSLEPSLTILQHAWKRKRPVIYSFAVGKIFYRIGNIFDRRYQSKIKDLVPSEHEPLQKFKFKLALTYLYSSAGDIWAIRSEIFLLRFMGIKSAIIIAAFCRNFPEVIACKILDISTVGILHGFASKNYNVYDFMPEFDGDKSLVLDKYGLWSEWWKEYYLKFGKAYASDQLFISGPMRPLSSQYNSAKDKTYRDRRKTKVLFVSEQLAVPTEVLPYLEILLSDKDIDLYLTFRSYKDGFEEWLSRNRPDLLAKVKVENILRSGIAEAIWRCDVVVGTMSTGVIESVLQQKPFVIFYTKKWGDYFNLGGYEETEKMLARDPEELVDAVRSASDISTSTINNLRKRFFGDPYKNGSKWVVDQALQKL